MIFTRIESRKPWLIGEIPKIHPESLQYVDIWRSIKKKVIEGLWGEDFGKYRYMPPNLYFYVNFGVLQHGNKKTKTRKLIKPLLIDTTWEFAYASLEARGFSGFQDDAENTSDRFIHEFSKSSTPVTDLDESLYFKPDGKFKDFISPREMLHKLHSQPLGLPLYNNEAKNIFILGSRSSGKSYWLALAELLHEIITDGAKYYTEETRKNPAKVETFIGSAIAGKSSETCEKIQECMNELAVNPDLGAWGKPGDNGYTPSPLYKSMAGSLRPNNNSAPWRHEYEKKVGGDWLKFGSKTLLRHGVYTTENPQAAAGGRYSKMVVDEVGLFTNVILAHFSNEACTTVDSTKYGTQIYAGTAGSFDKIIESQMMFTNPEEYNISAYSNEWENKPEQKIGFFLPAYYTNLDFKDEAGNTNLKEAKSFYEEKRKKLKGGKESRSYIGEVLNYPLYPSEMFVRPQGNYFPLAEVKRRLDELSRNNTYELLALPVSLEFDPNQLCGVRKKIDYEGKLNPIDTHPMDPKRTDREGAPVLYEQPILGPDGLAIPNLYMGSVDTVRDDAEYGTSLLAFYIMKTREYMHTHGHDEIVASYIARPEAGEHIFYENVEKLTMLYNFGARRLNFENMVGELKPYFEKRNKLWLLATKPELTFTNTQKGLTKSNKLIYGYPVNNQHHKMLLLRLARKWCLEERGKDNEGGVLRNIDLIPSKRLLQQMLEYSLDGNYDDISAFLGLMVMLEEEYNEHIQQTEDSYSMTVAQFFASKGEELFKRSRTARLLNQKKYKEAHGTL